MHLFKRRTSWKRFLFIVVAVAVLYGAWAAWPRPKRSDLFASPAAASTSKAIQIKLKLVADRLTAPVAMACPQDGSGRMFVLDQIGRIFIIDARSQLQRRLFLDISDRVIRLNTMYDERGLLGLAFHPDYQKNGRFFVYYSASAGTKTPPGYNSQTRLSEFRVTPTDANKADAASERIVLQILQPQPNHNGGPIAFGPDGYLYISVGDGGAANDAGLGHHPITGNAQDLSTLLGKILRIDVDGGQPYGIPLDNPFANTAGARAEIWAFGLRNCWGISFDRGSEGEMFAADVGQNLFEEINIIQRGGNYGWRIKEGNHCFDPATPNNPPADCPSVDANNRPLVEPILEYPHNDAAGRIVGISVAGGYVYRGKAIPALAGQYVFGDWSTGLLFGDGTLFVAQRGTGGGWTMRELPIAGQDEESVGRYLLALGQDLEGELYVLTSQSLGPKGTTGEVFKIVPVD